MSSSKSFLDYILERLSPLGDIAYRSMMGEYIVYYKGRNVAMICDDRLLVKPVKGALNYVEDKIYGYAYEGAKSKMLLIENVDDGEYLRGLIMAVSDDVASAPPQKPR